jgi:hypothetical protein
MRFFSTPQRQDPLNLPSSGPREFFPQRVKWLWRKADQSNLSSAEVKNGGAIPPLPHTSSWRGAQGLHEK